MTAALAKGMERDPVADIIEELAAARWRPDAALRRAVAHAGEIAPAVIELVEKAADGVCLMPRQSNLLFWGIHILAAGRRTELYQPLLRLVRLDRKTYFDQLLGDAVAATLPNILISVFDGDPASLFQACEDTTVDSYVRWSLLDAMARLTFDGAIPRQMTLDFLDRFERTPLAEPRDEAWEGWQDAVTLLAAKDLFERVRATWNDGRSPSGAADREIIEKMFIEASASAPDDPALFIKYGRSPIDDPAKALAWTGTEKDARPRRDEGRPDPAGAIALGPDEIEWLDGFLSSAHVSDASMTLEQVDGFFCALACGPSVPPGEYLPVIWNPTDDLDSDAEPDYDSDEQAEYVANLLDRHLRTIAQRLDGGYQHLPALEDDPAELAARYWVGGFIRGVAMRASEWGDLARGDDDGFASAFLNMLITLGQDKAHFVEGDIDFDMRQQLVDALPQSLLRMHHLWRGRDDPFPPPTPTRYEGRKIGRNEPCPCGSGKKFKRCCGSPDRPALN